MKRHLPSVILLFVTVLAYGLRLSQLGFYWDDLPISWIRYQLGSAALTEYFSTNRPVWGMLYQITTSVIPHEPIYWQIFALFWRWLGAVVVFAIVDTLWKDKPRFALTVALLFLLYPGFNQQWTSFLYSHFFIVLFFFLYSQLCMLRAMDEPRRARQLTALALLFSAFNLWMMEYFYVLELVRIGIILTALRGEPMPLRKRAVSVFRFWMPYLIVFALSILSRLFIFNNQVYGIGLTDQLQSAPLDTLVSLARTIRLTIGLVLRDAWMQVFDIQIGTLSGMPMSMYSLVFLGTIVLSLTGIFLLAKDRQFTEVSRLEDVLSSVQTDQPVARSNATPQWSGWLRRLAARNNDAFWAIGLGLFAILLSGWPFWLIGFTPSLAWPASRFTLPFLFGTSLFLAGIGLLIPWQFVRYMLIAALIGFAAGRQFLWSAEYEKDWATQKELFWQMTWRAPGIAPGTLVLMNEGALDYYADNSLSPVLNWVYAPANHSGKIEYVLFYPTNRLRSSALPTLEPDQPVFYDYLAGSFHGNTSQTLAMYYSPPGCLRILDPEIDRVNRLIPEPSLMRFASRLSNPGLILSEENSRIPDVFHPEPAHGFCYYFQRAELARQFGRWEEVVQLGNTALALDGPPIEAAERFVFIEGYAHAGDWDRAFALSLESLEVSPPVMGEMLCRLWERIEAETAPGTKRTRVLAEAWNRFGCRP